MHYYWHKVDLRTKPDSWIKDGEMAKAAGSLSEFSILQGMPIPYYVKQPATHLHSFPVP